ncbi:pre-60S factor rei1 [Basidiobolus ranarum]|uniref:Pre-60S factor rei1 n=1 Tax=Basidiobolus ranarum TaxID=34480 RepID=A0ABR2WHD4_9FUNG
MSDNTASENPQTALFTCLACHVAFRTLEHQRNHYRTDWHRYNLKRKVAELPPITAEVFAEKVLAQQAQTAQDAVPFKGECIACKKTYSSENAYTNHLQSKKHKEIEAKVGKNPVKPKKEESETPVQKELTIEQQLDQVTDETELLKLLDQKKEQAVRLEAEECLFCTQKSATFEDNIEHMTKAHSFFIPDVEYLNDLQGLIKYLGEKISVANICLYCNGKGRTYRTLEAVRGHMVDKGHCKIASEKEDDLLEISDYYDFTSSYPEEMQVGDDDEEMDIADVVNPIAYGEEETELVLPSGARVGHRSLKRYYQQNIKPEEERDSVIINRLLTHYQQNMGYRGSQAQALMLATNKHRVARDMNTYQDQRRPHEFASRVGVKANGLQKHFRAQIL